VTFREKEPGDWAILRKGDHPKKELIAPQWRHDIMVGWAYTLALYAPTAGWTVVNFWK